MKTLKHADMHKYQSHKMVPWIKQKPNSALWADPGLGKTVGSLTATKELRKEFEIDKTLVIAPLRVSQSTWPKEIQRWEHLQDMKCENLYWPGAEENTWCNRAIAAEGLHPNDRDSEEERIKKLKRIDQLTYQCFFPWLQRKLAKNADIYTINREQVLTLTRVVYMNWPFDNVIIDESSSFKSHDSLRFQALKAIRKKIYRILELTGTPASNGLMGLWPQMWLLDKGEALEKSITAYRNTYWMKSYNGYDYELVEGSKEKIYTRVEGLCMTMKAEDYLELPEWLPIDVPVVLPPRAQSMYDELEREFLLTIEDETVSAAHTAALGNKLRQVCNGAVYTDGTIENPETETQHLVPHKGKKKNWKLVHDAKIDALKDIYEEAAGTPILVAYNFKHDLARLLQAFKDGRLINTPQDEDDWNAGKIPIGFGHPASMGHGLNIQFGGHIGVWFGYTWDLELYDQFNKRLHRQGQEFPVITHHIYVDLPAETAMKHSLVSKDMNQRELMLRMKKEALNRN